MVVILDALLSVVQLLATVSQNKYPEDEELHSRSACLRRLKSVPCCESSLFSKILSQANLVQKSSDGLAQGIQRLPTPFLSHSQGSLQRLPDGAALLSNLKMLDELGTPFD
jgi:hypothetical protein